MHMMPLHAKLPKLAEKETRCLIFFQEKEGIPPGKYVLMESYCNDPSCDCRRVFINILHENKTLATIDHKILATIGYGWESLEFYKNWMGDDELIEEIKGPTLELTGPWTKFAPAFLKIFKTVVLKDKAYVERLKRHYHLFKQEIRR